MTTGVRVLDTYKELADRYERSGDPHMRDRFLVLAADAALAGGRPDEAERLRRRLLQANPHHLLKPYGSFEEALRSADVQTYVTDLRRNYPAEIAERLLASLQERETGQGPTRPIPPTAPLIDLDKPSGSPGKPGTEPLRVYSVREEEKEIESTPAPPESRRPPMRPDAPAPKAGPRPAPASWNTPVPNPPRVLPRPLPGTQPIPIRVEKTLPPARPSAEPDETATGSWLASLLFGVVLAAGLALAVFALGRPFLPQGWLP